MPTFQVLRRVDAFVDYVAAVEAETAAEAADLAREDEDRFTWDRHSATEFDARLFVTLDGEGVEIEETQTGDF